MRLLAAAIAALLLAGCSGGDPTPSASVGSATVTTPAPPPPPLPPAILVGVCETTSGLSYGLMGLTYNSLQPAQCPLSVAKGGDLAGLQSGLIEVVWTPGATVTGAGMILESDQCRSRTNVGVDGVQQEQCNHGLTNGPSPLVLNVPFEVLNSGMQNLTVSVLPEGASASQAFTVYVSLFEGIAPPGYTAIR